MTMKAGFTRVDLLAVIFVLALMAMPAAPAGARSKSGAELAVCINNVRQLSEAWTTFALDRNDTFAGTIHGGIAQFAAPIEGPGADPQLVAWQSWGSGWLDWETSSANTNYALFSTRKYGSLANYVGQNRELFKCPADVFLSARQRALQFRERVRSYASSVAVGEGNAETGPWNQEYLHARKFSQLVKPGPSMSYVFLEEHPDSMNECAFFSPYGSSSGLTAVDIPANHHDGAATFSFADGRVESHAWVGGTRWNRVKYAFNPPSSASMAADLQYLYNHTPRR